MAEPASRPAVDGRRLRSERTRQLIIEAYLALLREDPQVPTSAQIAERAGYSVRSVFERFPDLLSLRVAATDYAFALGSAQAVLRDVDGDRPIRIARKSRHGPRPARNGCRCGVPSMPTRVNRPSSSCVSGWPAN